MRIGFNARLLGTDASYRQTGVSRYITQLLDHLPAHLTEDDLLFVATNPAGAAPPPPVRRILWEQTLLPIRARRERWDVLHCPVNVLPLIVPCASVVTIHDTAFLAAPETMTWARQRYLRTQIARSIRQADQVLTVSRATADDLMRAFDVPADRITVTPLAADARFRPATPNALDHFRRQHDLHRPYILSVGTREPRKNIARLVRAFARIASTVAHDLVLVGPAGWLESELDEAIRNLPAPVRARIRLTGFVPDDDLPLWYAAADVFAYPALHEGFGLPVLEAMACGVPVVTSNTSSLPEIAGDAALLVDPLDERALADAIARVIGDDPLAEDLRRRGRARARHFSWDETARLTVAGYHAAFARRGTGPRSLPGPSSL